MSYQIEKLPNEPIVVIRFLANFNLKRDGEVALIRANDLLSVQETPVVLVADMQMPPPSIEELISAINLSARQLELFKHPNVCGNIFISRNRLIGLAALGAKMPWLGGLNIKVVKTMDDALSHIRQNCPYQSLQNPVGETYGSPV